MDLGENFKKSFMYPLCNYNKFAMFGVLSVFTLLGSILISFEIYNFSIFIIAFLIGFIISLYLTGYSISIIKNGIHVKEEIPDFEIGRDISNFFKYLVISIAYAFVPVIIFLIVFFGSGILDIWTKLAPYIQQGSYVPQTLISSFISSILLIVVVAVIVLVIQTIFTNIAIARMVANNSVTDGLDFVEVFHDIGKIGWFRTVGWFVAICIINILFYFIIAGILVIPYIGIIIASFFMLTFARLFNAYSIGLLYSNAYEINDDIRESSESVETELSDKKQIDSMYGENDG